MTAKLEPVESSGQWVRCSERLPEEGRTVLVDGGIARRIGSGWVTGMEEPMFTRWIQWDVTHWMPLPAAPKED